MQDYIKPESKVMQIFYKATECMLLSILWVITSLPIFTIGASTTALYYTVVKVIRNNEGYVWGEFWNGFRINFKQATIIWLVAALLLAGAVADIVVVYVLSVAGRGSRWLCLPFMILLAFGLMWVQYIFPYIARFEDRTKTVLFNTFWMVLFHFWHSVFLLIIMAAFITVVYMFPITIPLAIFFFPGVYTIISASILEARFKTHMKAEDAEDADPEEDAT